MKSKLNSTTFFTREWRFSLREMKMLYFFLLAQIWWILVGIKQKGFLCQRVTYFRSGGVWVWVSSWSSRARASFSSHGHPPGHRPPTTTTPFARVIVDGCCSEINKLRGAIDCPFCECGSQTGLFLFLCFAGECVKGDDPSFEKGKIVFHRWKINRECCSLYFLSASIDSSSLVLILLKTKIISKH